MADATKAQKLAAARKKLKEYQQKGQKPDKRGPENEEALSNSTHSSINGHFDPVPLEPVVPPQTSPFHNYFNGNQQNVVYQEPTNFFDSLSNVNNESIGFEDFNNVQICSSNEQNNYVDPTVISDDAKALEYPELKTNDVYGYFQNTVSSEDAKKLSEYLESETKLIDFQDSPNQEENNLNSNTESLRQLSSQITELIKDDETPNPSQTHELERRNQELAALLEQERLESQKVQTRLLEYQNRIVQLESESQQTKIDSEHRLNRELGPLQEQLQCHAQTVGILVGEKTELSTALSQSQLVAKQKITECEELQGRLKTSRSRVADLEKELQSFKSERSKFEQNFVQEEESKLKRECQELKEQKEEVMQDILELREKLNVKVNENLGLQREVQEISHQLSLAQVKISQITAGENLQVESQVEILTKQKLTLEKQVLELSQALKTTGEERDQASAQYQHYVQQLNGQVATLANKLETITGENETLANREQNLIKHIGELEKHLQNVQEEQVNYATNRGTSNGNKKELEAIQSEKDKLEEDYRGVLAEREELLREVEAKKELVDELETALERLQGDQPDNAKLLATMESDKVAAARAVAQNSQLKQELEEMQQAFVRMSNDKLELTDKLTSEEYRNKDLSEKLSQIEHQLHTLSDAIIIKDNELTHMRETLTHQNKQILQQDQLSDRLRHYEAQDTSSHALIAELQKAQDEIEHLTKENTKLKEDHEVVLVETSEHAENENPTESIDLKILDKEVAMKHLEEKFTRTMSDIANLTEEKQRLEHIVTQLQGETETIGEYIALYQRQRGILKQRTQEKDEQLKRLAQDREKVRSKLDILNALVQKLVVDKGVLTPELNQLCSEHLKIHEEINKNSEEVTENNNMSTETAEEIIALLAEIKSSNLIQPSDGLENFHPCPWCSGQLQTV